MARERRQDGRRDRVDRHAFVIDDEPQFRAFVGRMLQSMGFVAHEFDRLRGIEAALTLRRPGIIILDLSLRGADAIEVMRSLAIGRFAGHVLLVSGHGAGTLEDVRRIGARRGLRMAPPLAKPFRLSDLRARLAEVAIAGPEATADGLESALRNNDLKVWYQPKIALSSGAVVGAEALVRYRHSRCGVLHRSGSCHRRATRSMAH